MSYTIKNPITWVADNPVPWKLVLKMAADALYKTIKDKGKPFYSERSSSTESQKVVKPPMLMVQSIFVSLVLAAVPQTKFEKKS